MDFDWIFQFRNIIIHEYVLLLAFDYFVFQHESH